MKREILTEGSSLFLDFVRAVSVQLVVIGHGIVFCSIFTVLHQPHFPWMQNIAVVVFFVLSGYLISYSTISRLATNENYSYRFFLIDRFSRIYSAFIPALLFVLVVDSISIHLSPETYAYRGAFNLRTFFSNLFLLQAYNLDGNILRRVGLGLFDVTSFGSGRPFWTLAIEWWIYLCFGLLTITIIGRRKLSTLRCLLFPLVCVVPAWNLVGGRGNGLTLYWIFGLLIYTSQTQYKSLSLSKWLKFGLLVSIVTMSCLRLRLTMCEYDPVFAFLVAFGLLVTIDLCAGLHIGARLSHVVKTLAGYSYTLFLIHYTIFDFITTHFKGQFNPYTLFVLGLVASNVISWLIGQWTEGPLTRYIKQRLYRRLVGTVYQASGGSDGAPHRV